VAAALLESKDSVSVFAGDLFFALLLDADSLPLGKIAARVRRAANEAGFRDYRANKPPTEDDVRWVIYDTINMCRALDLLSVGAAGNQDSYDLTAIGKATALEALRARATAPATSPLPKPDTARRPAGMPCLMTLAQVLLHADPGSRTNRWADR
jgi:hypothetical protein